MTKHSKHTSLLCFQYLWKGGKPCETLIFMDIETWNFHSNSHDLKNVGFWTIFITKTDQDKRRSIIRIFRVLPESAIWPSRAPTEATVTLPPHSSAKWLRINYLYKDNAGFSSESRKKGINVKINTEAIFWCSLYA